MRITPLHDQQYTSDNLDNKRLFEFEEQGKWLGLEITKGQFDKDKMINKLKTVANTTGALTHPSLTIEMNRRIV